MDCVLLIHRWSPSRRFVARLLMLLLLVAAFTGVDADSKLFAAEPTGDLYQLGIALNQQGIRGHWRQLGKPQAWRGTRAGAILGDRLYTAEANGALYVTRLDNGQWAQVAAPGFDQTRLMFAGGGSLWTIEQSGTLYKVNPANGAWAFVGAQRAWVGARAGAILKGHLYTVETGGALQVANLADGNRSRVGSANFDDVTSLVAAGDQLYVIDKAGDLAKIDLQSGSRQRLGPSRGLASTLAATVVQDVLYTVRNDGTLHETLLAEGRGPQLGKAEFANTAFLFGGPRQCYTIERDGSLYEVFLHPIDSIDGWDCFPREFEKVFQEQAKSFYRASQTRLLLGKQCTHQAIVDQLRWLQREAKAHDQVVIYFTSHGATDPTTGWSVETADGKILHAHDLKAELAKLACHALVFIETCGSGGFAAAHQNDPPVPANVTALCACSGKQTASNELDIAALEGLWGKADFSRDGVVDLDELLRYVEARYKVMCPTPNHEGQLTRPVVVKSPRMPGSLRLTQASPRLGAMVHDGWLYAALIGTPAETPNHGEKFAVHVLGFNNQPGPYYVANSATRDQVCLPHEGPPLEVEQNGVWYPARLVAKVGDRYKVHYLGWHEEEVVTGNRVRRAFVHIGNSD
ncbi:MAG: caspase family protein [Planctomycetes bacterium]|nr:caspase family protein [Planctomycetota bacterium]